MANLSFTDYVNSRKSPIQTIDTYFKYQQLTEVNVLRLYRDYITWLIQQSKFLEQPVRYTATELLVQLKLVNAYYIHLLNHYNRTKSLTKPLELIPVPQELTQPELQDHRFTLPPTTLLDQTFKEKPIEKAVSSSRKLNFALAALFTVLTGVALTLLITITSNPFVFVPLLFDLTFGYACATIIFIQRAINQDKRSIIPAREPLDHPRHLGKSALIGVLGIAAIFSLPLVPTLPLSFLTSFVALIFPLLSISIFSGSMLEYFESHNLSKPVAINSLQSLRTASITHLLKETKDALINEIDPEFKSAHITSGLDKATTCVLHSYLATRVLPESANDDEFIPLDILEDELTYRDNPAEHLSKGKKLAAYVP